MKIPTVLATAALAISILLLSHPSYAFDLSGAWASDASACGKLFQKSKDDVLSIRSDSDMYGEAIIVRNDSIVGSNVACKIKSVKDDGALHHLVAVCAADSVALSTFQFSYRIKDDNNIVRIFPGVEELNVSYARCAF